MALATRNTKHTASALESLRSAGLVREAVAGDVRYVYLTERAYDESALRLTRRRASAASGAT